jgi:hypothetical protein
MAETWTRPPAAARLLAVVAAAAAMGCAEAPDAPPRAPRTGDYEVYAAVLREHFVSPPADDHGDGAEPACPAGRPLDRATIVGETRFRRRGGVSRDSALVAELPADAASLLAALRGMDRQPPRPLQADSFSLDVPVLLVADPADSLRARDGWGPITVSRVAYNADSTRALVHAARPCRAERGGAAEDGELDYTGNAVLAALDRQQGAWRIANVVLLYAE